MAGTIWQVIGGMIGVLLTGGWTLATHAQGLGAGVYGPLRVSVSADRIEAVYSVGKRACVLYLEGHVGSDGVVAMDAWVPGWPLNKAKATLTASTQGVTLRLERALGACATHAPDLVKGVALIKDAGGDPPAHPLGVVGSYRAFFYEHPDTAPMMKFVVAGDAVEMMSHRKGFLHVKYTGQRGVSTGWLREADLYHDTIAGHAWRNALLDVPAKGPLLIAGLEGRIETIDPVTGTRRVILKTPGTIRRLHRRSDGALVFSLHNRAGWAFYYWPPKQPPARWPALPHASNHSLGRTSSMMPSTPKTVVHDVELDTAGRLVSRRYDAAMVHDCWVDDDEEACGHVMRETPRGCYALDPLTGAWREHASCPFTDHASSGFATPLEGVPTAVAMTLPDAVVSWGEQKRACAGQCVVVSGDVWGTTAWSYELVIASLEGVVAMHKTIQGYSSCRIDHRAFLQFSVDTRFLIEVIIPHQKMDCLDYETTPTKAETLIHVLAGSKPQPRAALSITTHRLEHVDFEQLVYVP